MHIWAVANQKGGVGKTTTAVTLGGLLAETGRRTLLVDLDPHGSLTAYFKHDPDEIEGSVYTLFQLGPEEADAERLVRPTPFDRLAVLPASTALATLDRQLGAQDGKGLVVARTLALLAAHYDHVLIDCPPMLGVLMVNALAACQRLIVPVQTEFLALKGLERMLRTTRMVQHARRSPLRLIIVPTLFDRRTRASIDSLRSLREQHGDLVWPSVVPVDTRFREASRAGAPLSRLYPSARGAEAYRGLLQELLRVGERRAAAV